MSFWSDLFKTAAAPFQAVSGGGNFDAFNADVSQLGTDVNGALGDIGLLPKKVDPNAPGAQLDTSRPDATRGNLEQLIAQLQQQAQTGGGAWEQALANATTSAKNTVSAVGQSTPGVSRMGELRNIGEGQAAATQRGVGQGNVLRARAQAGAQDELAGLLGAEGQQDAAQAEASSAAAQQQRELQAALAAQAKQNALGTASAAGQVAAAASKGGEVPGEPVFGGDDERNDTVHALLSPGEIVIPRSHSGSPEAAAQFVAELERRHHGGHEGRYAGGGDTGISNSSLGDGGINNAGDVAGFLANPIGGINSFYGKLGTSPQAPSVQNGGLLDTGSYNANAGAQSFNDALLMQRASGTGLSAVPQETRNANDAVIAAAMGASGARPSSAAGNVARIGEAASGAGEKAGAERMGEQHGAAHALAQALVGQRASDLGLARAQQQAAWRNTELNAGLALAQQAQLQNMLGGLGAAAVGHISNTGELGDGNDSGSVTDSTGGDYVDAGAIPLDESGVGDTDSSFAQTNDSPGMASGGFVSAVLRQSTGAATDNRPDYVRKAEAAAKEAQTKSELAREVARRPRGAPEAYDSTERMSELEVQRAFGGSIPGYAGGGELPGWAYERWGREHTPEEATAQLVEALKRQQSFSQRVPEQLSVDPSVMRFGRPPLAEAPIAAAGEKAAGAAKDFAAAHPVLQRGLSMAAAPFTVPGGTLGLPGAMAFADAKTTAEQQKGLPAGLRLKEDAPTAAPQAPVKDADRAPIGVRSEGAPDTTLDKTFADERAAELAKGDLEAQKQTAAAAALGDQQKELQRAALEQKDLVARARADADSRLAQLQRLHDEVRDVDTTVDPGRFWATRSTGQKITGIIGLALGALGAGAGGINRAAGMLSQAVDRDIDAQKAEHEFRLRKGQAAVENARTLYGLARSAYGDELAGLDASKAMAMDLVKNRLAAVEASVASPVAKQQARLLADAVDEKKAAYLNAAQTRAADIALKRAEAAHQAAAAQKAATPGKNAEVLQGTLKAIDDLERQMKDPTSAEAAQARASLALHLNKLQGGRFNEEIHKMTQEIIPGNEGFSAAAKAGEQLDPELMARKFKRLREHVMTTANAPPAPVEAE